MNTKYSNKINYPTDFELDYEEISAGIERAREDIKCSRYSDIESCLERIRNKFCD